jgi:hypothetical protein
LRSIDYRTQHSSIELSVLLYSYKSFNNRIINLYIILMFIIYRERLLVFVFFCKIDVSISVSSNAGNLGWTSSSQSTGWSSNAGHGIERHSPHSVLSRFGRVLPPCLGKSCERIRRAWSWVGIYVRRGRFPVKEAGGDGQKRVALGFEEWGRARGERAYMSGRRRS